MEIQLPTSSEALLEQLRVHRQFVENIDEQRMRAIDESKAGLFVSYLLLLFLASVDKDAELVRLNDLEFALKSGASLTFA